jgi:hypothetical protein
MVDLSCQTILAWNIPATGSVGYDPMLEREFLPTAAVDVLSILDIVPSFEFSILDIVPSVESSTFDIVLSSVSSSLRIAPFSAFSNSDIGHGCLVHRP